MTESTYTTHWRKAVPVSSGIPGKLRNYVRHAVLSVSSVTNRTLENSFLRCLYCHYVFDDQRNAFERLIVKLQALGEFVDTSTCLQMLTGEKEIQGRYFHLSFDDGFRNNFSNAFPVLLKHHVPAIFFIPSSLMEASYDKTLSYCLKTTGYNSVIEMLTWEDLKEMTSCGYEIGSHTKTHARLSNISKDKTFLEDEILGSKQEIEKHLDTECKYISWPYGRLADTDAESLKMIMSAGYHACFGAFRGTVIPETTDVFSIPRHHFEVQWPVSHIEYFARGNMENS